MLTAKRLFKSAAQVDLRSLCRWRTCFDGHLDAPDANISRGALLQRIQEEPALVYLISEHHKQLLGDLAAEAHGSPWGYRLLPDTETFEQARETASTSLRRIADLRDQAFAEIDSALRLF